MSRTPSDVIKTDLRRVDSATRNAAQLDSQLSCHVCGAKKYAPLHDSTGLLYLSWREPVKDMGQRVKSPRRLMLENSLESLQLKLISILYQRRYEGVSYVPLLRVGSSKVISFLGAAPCQLTVNRSKSSSYSYAVSVVARSQDL